ncbi:MAG: hypothetical protein MJA83_02645 [Gammaproteobacteria bacterium]|nr:hypothetical protein [Gammaproteobacteria bacterium]
MKTAGFIGFFSLAVTLCLNGAAEGGNPSNGGEAPAEVLAAVKEHLMTSSGASDADIEVLQAESVVWNDGAMGCARPGEVYTQAIIPGYRIVLRYDGKKYHYHTDERGRFRLCSNSRDPRDKLRAGVEGASSQDHE